ncbi:MAG: methyltransferase [Vicinamibacterales bacterium]
MYIGPDSMWLLSALPASLCGKRVLDVCSGSGIQGLVCASRGARSVVALEKNPLAVSCARFNAVLNGLDDRYEVRESDLYTALVPGETFDLLVSNPPFMPAVQEVGFPMFADGGATGTELLERIVTELPSWIAEGGEAVFVAVLLGSGESVNFTRTVLAAHAREHHWRVETWVFGKSRVMNTSTAHCVSGWGAAVEHSRQTSSRHGKGLTSGSEV